MSPANQDGPPVIILLMGEIGAGKSSFINTAAGEDLTQVSDNWDLPCTTTVQHFPVRDPKCQRDVYFVDTPGFNQQKADGVILNEIIDGLEKISHSKPNVQFGGIIYLCDLSQPPDVANRTTIMKLNEPEPLCRVVLTTFGREGSKLETRLKVKVGERVQVQRFRNSKASAWTIVNTILAMESTQMSAIQDELAKICNQLPKEVSKKGKKPFNLIAKLFGFRI